MGQQTEYITILLSALPALKVHLEGGESVPILQQVVDRGPYTSFQLFRGPYACKMTVGGSFRPETRFEPEGYLHSDPLTCFVGHVEADQALQLPTVQQILSMNEEVRHFHEQLWRKVESVS